MCFKKGGSLNSGGSGAIAGTLLHELAHIAGVEDENFWKFGKDIRSQFAPTHEVIATNPSGFGLASIVNYWEGVLGGKCCPPREKWMINDWRGE